MEGDEEDKGTRGRSSRYRRRQPPCPTDLQSVISFPSCILIMLRLPKSRKPTIRCSASSTPTRAPSPAPILTLPWTQRSANRFSSANSSYQTTCDTSGAGLRHPEKEAQRCQTTL